MTNEKWFALVAAFGLALTVAACGEDDEPTSCQSDEDCADDETCDTSCQLCASIDAQCATDAECTTEGETCQPIGEGCTAKTCKSGEGPGPVSCTPETFDVCYDLGQECLPSAGECRDVDVGSCSAVAGKETPAVGGPLLYFVEKNGECEANDVPHCAGGTSCAFNLYWWDPDGDVDAEYSDVKYVTEAGNVTAIGFVDPGTVDGKFGSVIAYTCVGNNPAAVLIQDNAGNQSNAMCLAGR